MIIANKKNVRVSESLKKYFKENKLPKRDLLISRHKKSGIFYEKGEEFRLYEKDIDSIESFWNKNTGIKEVKGNIAFKGKVKGKVNIISDFKNIGNFKEGDILVTGMTDPNFVPLMEKAGAIVTDAGGILCHASIVSRELKKPCIVGTQIATRVFKTGDIVEVDANKGIVKKIK